MNAQRLSRRTASSSKRDERSSGVFELPASSRVTRRGSTRVEPSSPAEPAQRGRGRSPDPVD